MAQTGTAVEQSHTVLTTPRFTLTPTENMWNFLLLDTATGRVWQVQYSVSKDIPKTTYSINTVSLISSSEPLIPGRFTLIPTKNVWNFLLLDQIDGRVWQLQFSVDGDEYRWITRIY